MGFPKALIQLHDALYKNYLAFSLLQSFTTSITISAHVKVCSSRRSKNVDDYVLLKKHFRCHHNTLSRSRKPSMKHTLCKSFLHFKVVKNIAYVCIRNAHNHLINAAAALKFRVPSFKVKEKFRLMFASKKSVAQPLNIHRNDLSYEYGDELYLVLGDRYYMPDSAWAYRLYYRVYKELNGSSHGMEMFQSLRDAVTDYNNECGSVCAILELHEDGTNFVLTLSTPLMKRAGEMSQSGEMMFMDASTNVDRYGCQVFLMMVNSAAGGVPVGIIITTGESENVITVGLQMFLSLLSTSSFGGRGQNGPKVIMTDDSLAERNALSVIFPRSNRLLCTFHVLQAAWRYLWSSTTGIVLPHRQVIFSFIKKLVYAESELQLQGVYETTINNELVCNYPKAKSYITKLFKRKHEWSVCLRQNLITRGQNTNNICEAAVRVLKDRILDRVNAFSPVQLFHFITVEMNKFYEIKLLRWAAGRPEQYLKRQNASKILKSQAEVFEVKQLSCNLYEIINITKQHTYTVDPDLGICSCKCGETGAICKHQIYLSHHVKGKKIIDPLPTEDQRIHFHHVATGKQPVETWYSDLIPDEVSSVIEQELHVNTNLEINLPVTDVNQNCQRISSDTANEELREFVKLMSNKLERNPEQFIPAIHSFFSSLTKLKTDTALTSALHMFGKCNAIPDKKYNSSTISVQPTAVSRRKHVMGGRKCLSSGRIPKWAVPVEHNYEQCQRSSLGKSNTRKSAAPHNLSYCVESNKTLGKKH